MKNDDFMTGGEAYGPFPFGDGDAGFGSIPTRRDDRIIDDATVADTETQLDESANYVGHTVGKRTLATFAVLLSMAGAVVLCRAGQVQIARAAYYANAAEGNRNRIERVMPERGIIYDRGGRPLVRNVPNFHAALTPTLMPESPDERRSLLAKMALMLDIAPRDIELRLAGAVSPNEPTMIAENIAYDQAIRTAIESASTPAVTLIQGSRRDYVGMTDMQSLSHVLGYDGNVAPQDLQQDTTYGPLDFIGKTGIEKQYEGDLRGVIGTRRVEVDARANRSYILAEESATPGKDIVLTIDIDVQRVAERSLREYMARDHKTRGGVIVMQPTTGEILALVSLPSFDDNLFAKGIKTDEYRKLASDPDHPLLSRTIAGSLPAGSTFKLTVAAAAIDEGIVTEQTSVVSVGGIHYGGWFFPDWKPGGHGVTNLAKAIGESVNTYFYTVGGGYGRMKGLGPNHIALYAKKFGMGAALGIDLPGEGKGFVPTPEWKERVRGEKWYIGDTYHFAIGQGDLLVTPLQIAAETMVFANNGKLMQPHLVRSVIGREGKRVAVTPRVLSEQVVSPRAIAAVRAGMRYAVTSGSAQSLKKLPVEVAAKTGTAQWHPTKPTHAWFTSFAPYDDPELSVTVFVEEGGEGSHIAAPVAKSIYSWYFGERKKQQGN